MLPNLPHRLPQQYTLSFSSFIIAFSDSPRKACIIDGVSKSATVTQSRLITLDYLRGFFIVVIVIDHLSRFPSILALISGKALLWVTAAEGFVAISGLLVGYVRGYKNKDLPMKDVTIKLLRRAGLLYVWSIIGSLVYTAIIWYVPLMGGAPGLPIDKSQWVELIYKTVTLEYTYLWVHFLTLYALFLAAAPMAVWLLRNRMAWVVAALSIAGLLTGYAIHNEALQWQVIFFIPSIAGYYLSSIMKWWKELKARTRGVIASGVISLTLATILLSVITTFYGAQFQPLADFINSGFAKDVISPERALMAFLWFVGFILIFNLLSKYIGKIFGWLLLPFGTHSLTAYILHGAAICVISYFTLGGDNVVENSLLGIICILIVWILLKIPIVQRIVPS